MLTAKELKTISDSNTTNIIIPESVVSYMKSVAEAGEYSVLLNPFIDIGIKCNTHPANQLKQLNKVKRLLESNGFNVVYIHSDRDSSHYVELVKISW